MSSYAAKQEYGVSRILYWLSLLLLIIGGRTLIDPSHRTTGETIHVYITLITFELYIWMLLILARWQQRQGLINDLARSGGFAILLQGLLFVATNEMSMASPAAGIVCGIAVLALGVTKLLVAQRWLNLAMPRLLTGLSISWLVLMFASGLILSRLMPGQATQQAAAFALCWAAAIIGGLHVVAALRAKVPAGNQHLPWWSAWVVSGGLGAMTLVQLYSSRWGMFVDFPVSFFAPAIASAMISAITLHLVTGQGGRLAWAAFVSGACFIIGLGVSASVEDIPDRMRFAEGLLVHPLYPGAAYGCLLGVLSGVRLRNKLLIALGLAPLAIGAMIKLVQILHPYIKSGGKSCCDWLERAFNAIMSWRYSQGVLLLAGAFVVLGLAAFIQWWKASHAPVIRQPLPLQEPEELPETISDSEDKPAGSD